MRAQRVCSRERRIEYTSDHHQKSFTTARSPSRTLSLARLCLPLALSIALSAWRRRRRKKLIWKKNHKATVPKMTGSPLDHLGRYQAEHTCFVKTASTRPVRLIQIICKWASTNQIHRNIQQGNQRLVEDRRSERPGPEDALWLNRSPPTDIE